MPYRVKVEPDLKFPVALVNIIEVMAAVERHKETFAPASLVDAEPLVMAVL